MCEPFIEVGERERVLSSNCERDGRRLLLPPTLTASGIGGRSVGGDRTGEAFTDMDEKVVWFWCLYVLSVVLKKGLFRSFV